MGWTDPVRQARKSAHGCPPTEQHQLGGADPAQQLPPADCRSQPLDHKDMQEYLSGTKRPGWGVLLGWQLGSYAQLVETAVIARDTTATPTSIPRGDLGVCACEALTGVVRVQVVLVHEIWDAGLPSVGEYTKQLPHEGGVLVDGGRNHSVATGCCFC